MKNCKTKDELLEKLNNWVWYDEENDAQISFEIALEAINQAFNINNPEKLSAEKIIKKQLEGFLTKNEYDEFYITYSSQDLIAEHIVEKLKENDYEIQSIK